MSSVIRDCLPPVRDTRKPKVALPKGSIDTHVHVFEPGYKLSPSRGYNPPDSTLADLKALHATLGIDRVVFTQPSIYGIEDKSMPEGLLAQLVYPLTQGAPAAVGQGRVAEPTI